MAFDLVTINQTRDLTKTTGRQEEHQDEVAAILAAHLVVNRAHQARAKAVVHRCLSQAAAQRQRDEAEMAVLREQNNLLESQNQEDRRVLGEKLQASAQQTQKLQETIDTLRAKLTAQKEEHKSLAEARQLARKAESDAIKAQIAPFNEELDKLQASYKAKKDAALDKEKEAKKAHDKEVADLKKQITDLQKENTSLR